MEWNLKDIKFLYRPDVFTGSFSNEKMQARHLALQKKKIDAIHQHLASAPTALDALSALHHLDHIQFLQNNIEIFRGQSSLEKAVLKLYRKYNSAFNSSGEPSVWYDLFNKCDANMFYDLGSPLPGDPITAYRGSVVGVQKGLCWTISKKKVTWFTERWKDTELGGGTIFSTSISRKDTLIYLGEDEDSELIVSPEFLETAMITAL